MDRVIFGDFSGSTRPGRRAGAAAVLMLGLALPVAGCQSRAELHGAEGLAPASVTSESKAAPAGDREVWEVTSIQGVRVGHSRTAVRHASLKGEDCVEIEGSQRLSMRRFGTVIVIDVRFTSKETSQGKLLECESVFSQGNTTVTTTGRLAGGEFQLQVATNGKTTTSGLGRAVGVGGYNALQQSLRRAPMKPGETRTVRSLEPGPSPVSTTRLVAGAVQTVKLLDKSAYLLCIDTTTTLDEAGEMEQSGAHPPASAIKGSLWTDAEGEILKTQTDMLAMESYRTTKDEALRAAEAGDLDVALNVSVPVERALPNPHQTKRVRYRVRLEGGNPAEVFVSCASQQVRAVDSRTAEATVFALRPGRPGGNPDAKSDPPTDDDRQPNNWIQSDHPKIIAAAKEAAGDLKEPWPLAVALERYAHSRIRRPGYSQAFDTALDVLESGQGDCTEHAVLLAALARARGIPARVAIGLVYVDKSFLYHMWTEMYLEGRWIAMDATLAQGGIGAAHLKVTHTSLHGASALSSFLPVAQVAGRLKIEIVEAE
jgi:hypothetical protein